MRTKNQKASRQHYVKLSNICNKISIYGIIEASWPVHQLAHPPPWVEYIQGSNSPKPFTQLEKKYGLIAEEMLLILLHLDFQLF